MTKKTEKLTPMMKQYMDIKGQNPNHILFFRLGDFYEMFFDDAKIASKVLDLTLTTRGKHLDTKIPLAGFPHHQLDNYLPRIVKAGYKVAVCDQTEDPKFAEGIVKRDVIEIITAGTALSENIIDSSSNNYLLCAWEDEKSKRFGFAVSDISTGEFLASNVATIHELVEIIEIFDPAEILISQDDNSVLKSINEKKYMVSKLEGINFIPELSVGILKDRYKLKTLRSLGFEDTDPASITAGVILAYLKENIKSGFSHLNVLKKYDNEKYCSIDYRTRKNLEILEPVNSDGDKSATLYAIMNFTKTPMGSRLLKKWLINPLKEGEKINSRLEITESLLNDNSINKDLSKLLNEIVDIERLSGKISTSKITPAELLRLKDSLSKIPEMIQLLKQLNSNYVNEVISKFEDGTDIITIIENSISEDCSLSMKDGGFIKKGYSTKLDDLYDIINHGKEKLLALQAEVKEELGIPHVKVGFNKVFGYYFEVTKKYADQIPDNFVKKQTLVNSDRFINEKLKVYEEKILNADEKISNLEKKLFEEIKVKLLDYISLIKNNSHIIANLDSLHSFAIVAQKYNFTRPIFVNTISINIKNGRHPVVERMIETGKEYIPNDLDIPEDANIQIITGPNMSGKSTYLRQTALIVLLAQAGSFVPADLAEIGMVDKIFTRVGASDNLAGGESTFLVEMNETANILNNATPQSLIIFDEVGRGTATFDGLSLAWSIIEYIHNTPKLSSRTLFATHYHELTEIDRICSRVRNYSVSVKEYKDEIIFMRKIIPGGADHSYGIYVAQLAGLPKEVIQRASIILANLEENELTPDSKPKLAKDKEKVIVLEQPNLFSSENDIVREKLSEIDINNLTPIEALNKLVELKGMTE
ncbi:MAG: DNA mismatch repair protein MutS [Candidatus Delongbacteria bacterium]|jgi:DNA mismatch repair protein MutS|nr:DNA mismatch repair protein MutS [Candidatus Delongbacteria bacterium]